MLCADSKYVYFVNNQRTGVIRVDPTNFDRLEIPLADTKIFQISVVGRRIYALSEKGTLQLCHKKRDPMFRGKNISTKPGEASEDEYEEDYDEENDHTYCTRQVSIKTSLDKDGEAEAENASLIEGSDGENTATNKVAGHDEGDQHDDEIENPPTDLSNRELICSAKLLLPHIRS